MLDFKNELEGRAVFVTGADGFIGSHLCDKLVEYRANVHVFVEASAQNSLANISHLASRLKVHRGNITDIHSVTSALKRLKAEGGGETIVFHLAAQSHVGESWDRPVETLMVNTIGTFNLLQSVIDVGLDIRSFDYAGTSEEFGNNNGLVKSESLKFHEQTPVNPTSIYATSKLAGDFLSLNFFHAYGLPTVITRMFNNYGPRQSPRFLTPTIITQALERDKIVLGNTRPRRDFCYVDDGVNGHLTIALRGKPGEIYCYGYGKDISVDEWARLILRVGAEKGYWTKDKVICSTKKRFRPGKSDVMRLRVDYEKLNSLTGWRPVVSWEEGLALTIKWYSENRDKWLANRDW